MRQLGQEDETGRIVGANGEGHAEDNAVNVHKKKSRQTHSNLLTITWEIEAAGWMALL